MIRAGRCAGGINPPAGGRLIVPRERPCQLSPWFGRIWDRFTAGHIVSRCRTVRGAIDGTSSRLDRRDATTSTRIDASGCADSETISLTGEGGAAHARPQVVGIRPFFFFFDTWLRATQMEPDWGVEDCWPRGRPPEPFALRLGTYSRATDRETCARPAGRRTRPALHIPASWRELVAGRRCPAIRAMRHASDRASWKGWQDA